MAPTLSVTLSPGDSAPHASPDETASLDINLEALETPSGSESGTLHELEWEGETASQLIRDQRFLLTAHTLCPDR